jgi:hypothetical protein
MMIASSMIQLRVLPACNSGPFLKRAGFTTVRPCLRAVRPRTAVAAPRAQQSSEIGAVGLAAAAAGLVANPIVLLSEYTLATTGSGLPPGPGGAYGAAEGVSYLVIVGLVAWSLYTKKQTGSGLPAGPAGLLGAAEGFSYLSLVIGIVVAGLQAAS